MFTRLSLCFCTVLALAQPIKAQCYTSSRSYQSYYTSYYSPSYYPVGYSCYPANYYYHYSAPSPLLVVPDVVIPVVPSVPTTPIITPVVPVPPTPPTPPSPPTTNPVPPQAPLTGFTQEEVNKLRALLK